MARWRRRGRSLSFLSAQPSVPSAMSGRAAARTRSLKAATSPFFANSSANVSTRSWRIAPTPWALALLYSLIQKEAISSRSTKRSEVPLKRKGEGLEVLFFSLLLFPSRRRSETLKASPSS
jgi:hypothetical protein